MLSLACGQGQDARLLARLGARVTAVDVSAEMLRHARRHEEAAPRGIAYVECDAHELAAFADESFDGVLCHMALMDIPDLDAATRSVARVLGDGGWFVFSIVHPCYGGHVEAVTDYLLDHRYAGLLADTERELADLLEGLGDGAAKYGDSGPWARVRLLLEAFGHTRA